MNYFFLASGADRFALFSAHIPNVDQIPLRIAVLSKRWEPSRVPMPRFMVAWVCKENESLSQPVPVLLRSGYENIVVWRSHTMNVRERKELFVDEGEIRFSKVFAMSGSGRD